MTSHRRPDANSSDSHRRGAAPPLTSLGRRVIDPPVSSSKSKGTHFLTALLAVSVPCMCYGAVVVADSLLTPMEPTRLLCPWDSSGKNTGVHCHLLLQRIFPTQGSNLGLTFPVLLGRFFTTSPPGNPYLRSNPGPVISWLCDLWARNLTSLGLSFFIDKMEMIIVPISKGFWEN